MSCIARYIPCVGSDTAAKLKTGSDLGNRSPTTSGAAFIVLQPLRPV